MAETPSREKLLSVQALRGIAALLVVIFHIDAMFREGAPRSREFGDFWARGFAGVDMFFVISGFIMVYVTQNIAPSLKSAGRFLYSRITRIYPLWWVFAGLMMLYFYTAVGAPAAPNKAQGGEILPYIAKSLLLLPQAHDPVLGVGWTLIHEMLFYILFAAGLMLPRKFLPFWLGLWVWIIIAYSNLGPSQPLHAKNLLQLFMSPINVEFVMGAAVALLLIRYKDRILTSKTIGLILLLAGAGLFIAGLLFHVPGKHGTFNWIRALAYGLPSAMMVLGAVCLERRGDLQVPNFLQHIGNWSYSLYLSHFLVIRSIKRIWLMANDQLPDSLKWDAPGLLDNFLYITLAIVASLMVAWISYHLIERTSLKLLRRKTRS